MASFNLNPISVETLTLICTKAKYCQIEESSVEAKSEAANTGIGDSTGKRGHSANGWLEVTFSAPSVGCCCCCLLAVSRCIRLQLPVSVSVCFSVCVCCILSLSFPPLACFLFE